MTVVDRFEKYCIADTTDGLLRRSSHPFDIEPFHDNDSVDALDCSSPSPVVYPSHHVTQAIPLKSFT